MVPAYGVQRSAHVPDAVVRLRSKNGNRCSIQPSSPDCSVGLARSGRENDARFNWAGQLAGPLPRDLAGERAGERN